MYLKHKNNWQIMSQYLCCKGLATKSSQHQESSHGKFLWGDAPTSGISSKRCGIPVPTIYLNVVVLLVWYRPMTYT